MKEFLKRKWQRFSDSPEAVLIPFFFALILIAVAIVFSVIGFFSFFELMR
jgi:hypothetical protein